MKTILILGMGRCGLTVTMQMLCAGGYPCYGAPPAFEVCNIDRIPFATLSGKAIKVLQPDNTFWPPKGEYHVITIQRDSQEQAKSMGKLLNYVGEYTSRARIREMAKVLPEGQ